MKARTLTTFIATVLTSALLPALGAAQQVEYYHLDAIGSVRAITEVRHARRYILGLSNTHELVSTSSSPTEMTVGWDPNGAVNRDTQAGYDEARRNSTK